MKLYFILNKVAKFKNTSLIRCLYSQNGIWPRECPANSRKELEVNWMDYNRKFPPKPTTSEKYYVLSMFPYPSGKLHMGHVRVYAISDAVAWFHRLRGKSVIHPMGWDAFGLPAENAAIERNEEPHLWTQSNIKTMKKQLLDLGISFDWEERELATCDPKYYKWTQYLFLKLYERGLAYRREAMVNWDPVDNTVLADEQVDENGCSWRSGAKVEKKKLRQWFIRTTVHSKELYDRLSLPEMKQWRDIVKLQRHWIGECSGYAVDFKLKKEGRDIAPKLTIWTDKLGHLNEAKFVTISPEHYLNCETYQASNGKLTLKAINPLNKEEIPILICENCEYPESTNCKLLFPTLNQEDHDLAKNLGLNFDPPLENEKVPPTLTSSETQDVFEKLKSEGVVIYPASQKLRDWLISRQRYWGTPIPIIHCDNCGEIPVPFEELPVVLPHLDNLTKTEGISPLEKAKSWMNVKCPKCNKDAKRETDTMDTFVDSSWYYLRYLDVKNEKEIISADKKHLMPVDIYIGGKEHAIMHLYYARFISQFCYSLGIINNPEPFSALLVQGMVLGQTYKSKSTGKYLKPEEIDKNSASEPIEKATGETALVEWDKMSKSKHNGVDPQDVIEEHGVDALRLFILADVGPNTPRKWNSERFDDLTKWMNKLWLTVTEFRDCCQHKQKDTEISKEEIKKQEEFLFDARNYYIKGATSQFVFRNQISIAISKIQALSSSIRSVPKALWSGNAEFEKTLAAIIISLTPIMPHYSSELWEGFRSVAQSNSSYDITKKVTEQNWPEVDSNYNLDLKIKINNDDKGKIKIPRYKLDILTQSEALDLVYNNKELKKYFEGKEARHVTHELYPGIEYILKFNLRKIKKQK